MTTRMEELALSFPSLRGAPGVQPWKAFELDQWAEGATVPLRARCAAQFVLAVWNPAVRWDCGRFNAIEALCCWDPVHRFAFLQWATEPWWP